MRATEGGGDRRRSGRLPPAARSAVASRGAASRGGNGRSRTARAAPAPARPRGRLESQRSDAGAARGRPAPARLRECPGLRGGAANQAPREPRALLQGPSLGSRLPSSFLLGALRGSAPLAAPRRPPAPCGADRRRRPDRRRNPARLARSARSPRGALAGLPPYESKSPAVSRRASLWFGVRSDFAFRRFRSMPRPSRPMRATDGSGRYYLKIILDLFSGLA